ncbi:MAG TPA: hypothetical protein VJU79_05050 [Candidatus Dormibacteraeota bacterium]|nr:hypothetical protein [Candidatus Dormibacteraeota bacterium]
MNFASWLQDHAAVAVALLAVVLGFLCSYLLRRVTVLRRRLRVAEQAAEEAVRTAALAAPGGIDPEVVMELLRDGRPPTLDNVYALMQSRERSVEVVPEVAEARPQVAAEATPQRA